MKQAKGSTTTARNKHIRRHVDGSHNATTSNSKRKGVSTSKKAKDKTLVEKVVTIKRTRDATQSDLNFKNVTPRKIQHPQA